MRPKQNSQAASEGVDEVREVGEALDALRLSGGAEPTGELGWAEGAASPAALPENSSADVRAPEANGRRADVRARRASHDGSAAGGSAKPAAFGTSIWG